MFFRGIPFWKGSAGMGGAGSGLSQGGKTTNLRQRLWNRFYNNLSRSGRVKGQKPETKLSDRTVSITRTSSLAEFRHISGEVVMDKMVMLGGDETDEILRKVIEKKVPAIMSYLSKDKWHVAKVILTDILGNRMTIESMHSDERQHPINIRIGQPVGISFKYTYGKFVFDTTVVALEPSTTDSTRGGTMVIDCPTRIGVVERRSYFRVNVPESLKVNVVLWHRSQKHEAREQLHNYYQAKLIDISAGGAQLLLPMQDDNDALDYPQTSKPNFKKGQFIGLRFTPLPYETPLMLNAQIRNILPTADKQNLCLGLQIVGLEASPEGRQVLSRVAAVVERYYQISQTGVKQQDLHGTTKAEASSSAIPASTTQMD
jgi:hypothetical protein